MLLVTKIRGSASDVCIPTALKSTNRLLEARSMHVIRFLVLARGASVLRMLWPRDSQDYELAELGLLGSDNRLKRLTTFRSDQ